MKKTVVLAALCAAAFLGILEVRSNAASPITWFKADSLSGLNNGATVQTWADSSGNGRDATQSSGGQRPTYGTDASGRSFVHFNGAKNTWLTFSRPVQDDFTITCVFRSTQGIGSGNLFYQGAGLVNGECGGVVDDFGTCLFANGSVCAGTGNPDVALNSAAGFNDGYFHVLTFTRTRSSGLLALYMDGVLVGTMTGGTTSLTTPAILALGAQQTAINFFDGDIAEVQIYASVLSDSERLAMENGLVQKFKIAPSIPTGLYLQLQSSQFSLHWQPTAGASGYYIKRSLSQNGNYVTIATNATTSFVDLSAPSTNVLFYCVSAFNSVGESANSAPVGTESLVSSRDAIGPSSRTTPIAISEIMYKPNSRADGKNVEFIELYNSNPWFHDISGYKLTCADVSYIFPAGTIIASNSFLVVAAAPDDIQSVYGITNVVGPYTGSLKKSETLQLQDEAGAVLLTVPYSNVSPWPVAAAGTGHSIVLSNPTYGEGDPRAWDISDVVGGSPGERESFHPDPLRNVVINEILPHSENAALPQFIELYNHSAWSVDLSGCVLTDDLAINKCVIPSGTVIGPGGFVSFDQSQLGFALNGAGGTLYFAKPDRSRILDAVQFGAHADGLSYGRWPDGANDFYAFSSRTPGTNNSAILIGDIVINELMYDPITGNDDDQYIELYNQGTNTVNLKGWQLTSAVTFTFPSVTIAPNGYLVVARNLTNLFAKYPNLNSANTVGSFSGKLSHSGEQLTLTMPQALNTNTIINVAVDQVSYGNGGRWGQWSHGGGSSLELIDPRSNHRLASNWADSDETQKSSWTNIEFTGVLDNGFNFDSSIAYAQIGGLDAGECLVDNVEVRDSSGVNCVSNPDFENGLNNWSLQGDHVRSSLENSGYASGHSLHVRNSDRYYNGDNSCQVALNANSLASGQTATLRFKARWLHGWPEVVLRLNGGWLEATGSMPVPNNLGTPGMPNSRLVPNAGPAIYNVTHFPSVPAANQPVIVTAQVHDPNGIQNLTLNYRLDPSSAYTSVAMKDDGTGGDAMAGDGIFTATIPGQGTHALAAFYISATDRLSATTRFPALLTDNTPTRECLVMFGDDNPVGSFGVYHLWITQANAARWANLGNLSNEGNDCTMVNGSRVIYNAQAHFAGSPVHQNYNTPDGNLCTYKWTFNDDDKFLGATSFNKIHVPGNDGIDSTIQREQAANTFLRSLGVPWLNRRYVVVYVNGNRRGPLMEDAQTPGSDVIKEHYPDDSDGTLYKVARYFEFAPFSSGYSMPNTLMAEATILPYTTTGGAKKIARYRWTFENRGTPDSANNYTNLFSLIDAANSQGTPNYVRNVENVADMENWMRVLAANHAAGNWDCFGCSSGQNLYFYCGTLGTKWSLHMFDFNLALGVEPRYAPGQDLFTTLGYDTNLTAFFNEPAFRRMYLRALGELVSNGPLNLSFSAPLINAKFSAFKANGINVEDPSVNLIPWIATAGPLVASQVNALNTTNFSTDTSIKITNNVAYLTGQAPFDAETILVNGASYPLKWTSATNWSIAVPLQNGTNLLTIVAVKRSGQPIVGGTNATSVVFSGTNASPVGQVVINEIMHTPAVGDAQYIELYNASTNTAFDLSGWQLKGVSYTFPNGSVIGPDEYLVLAANRAAFAGAYGATNPVFDTFSGTLGSSDTLSLLAPIPNTTNKLTVTAVQFGNSPPWPTNANATGGSLQLIDPHQDNWRVGNWSAVSSNSPVSPRWVHVTATGTASSSILYIYLESAGDLYIDDLKMVAGSVAEVGVNVLPNGDFESGLSSWTVSPNLANSTVSQTIKHSGNASLHLVSTSGGTTQGSSIWQSISPALTPNATYTLSFWYLQNTNGGPLTVRLSYSGIVSTVNPALPAKISSMATPGTLNSVANSLVSFPTLWINELQADNLNGITNSADQHVPWLEIFNPGTNSIPLKGLYLANNYTNLLQWPFPSNAVINAGEYKVIFADGLTNLSTPSQLHAVFTLRNGSGSIVLTRLDGNGQPAVLDYVDYNNVTTNNSFGSYPDGQSFKRQEFFRTTPGSSNDGTSVPPASYIVYSQPGSVYSQNFDSLPNPGGVSVNSDNPVTINGVIYSLANPFDFARAVSASGNTGGLGISTMAGWYGYDLGGAKFGATSGDQTTGGQISFGSAGSAERALGLLNTSSTTVSAFGARFINGTALTLSRINVQVTGELWRQSNLPKTLQFYYAVDPTGTNTFPTSGTVLPALNVSLPTVAANVGGVAVNGNLSINQTNLSLVNQTITNWLPGAALWLVWQMTDATGKAQGLGIDNFSFSADLPLSVPLNVQVSGTDLQLSWSGAPGQIYQVEYKNDLAAPTWTPLGDPVTGSGGTLTTTANFGASAQRFFRLRLVNF